MRLAAMLMLATLAVGCGEGAFDTTLQIREPTDRHLFASVDHLELHAERDGRTIAQASFAPTVSSVSLSGVPYGPLTTFTLDGLTSAGDVVAHGSTCPLDFESAAQSAALYFAPAHLFAPTPAGPPTVRDRQMALSLDSGDVLFVGGLDGGLASATAVRYLHASATFVDAPEAALGTSRAAAEVNVVPKIGTLLTGGVDANDTALASAEIYLAETGQLSLLANGALGARKAHRATTLSDDRVLLTGGVDDAGKTLNTSALVGLQPDGSAQVTVGPALVRARSGHAAVIAIGTPVLLGGYGADGVPLASIEALTVADNGDIGAFQEIAQLQFARAEATATVLSNGAILVIGGVGADGVPRDDAEVYNPVTRGTTIYQLGTARHGHTATTLPDGRVLVVGGLGIDGQPIKITELFIIDIGFVSEQPLIQARAGHLAVALCDGTVLIEGGAADAELYTPPAM